jgi:hypothetical protein
MERTIQQVSNDLALIRGAIERAEKSYAADSKQVINLRVIILVIAFLGSAALGLNEIISNGRFTQSLIISKDDPMYQIVGLIQLGSFLLFGAVSLYLLVFFAAKRQEESFERYLSQHFIFLKNFSFLSDLFIKFLIFSLIIASQRPEWISALLLLFIGDYLLQGRFFIFPLKVAVALSIVCIGSAVAHFIYGIASTADPLLTFAAISLLNLCYVKLYKQRNG